MSIPVPKLREYQRECVVDIGAAHRAGHNGVLLQMATGAGKTITFLSIIAQIVNAGGIALIIVPRDELVRQTCDKLRAFGIRHGIIASKFAQPDAWAPVQVAMILTLRQRPAAMPRKPHYIVIDEGHLAAAASYDVVLERYPDAKLLLATATPTRLDGEGFDHLCSALIVGPSVKKLIELNAAEPTQGLVPFDTFSIPLVDFSTLKAPTGGDYNREAMAKAYEKQALIGDAVGEYERRTPGKTACFFTSGVNHSKQLVERFNARGWKFRHIDATTKDEERREVLGDPNDMQRYPGMLGTGEIHGVCNYGILTEGFDCPRIEALGVVRSTMSEALWRQIGGRCLRPAPWAGKFRATIFDFGGNALRHGNLDYPRPWSLYGQKNSSATRNAEPEIVAKACRTCQAVMPGAAPVCTVCGAEFRAATATRDAPKTRDGQLELVAAGLAPVTARVKASFFDRAAAGNDVAAWAQSFGGKR